MLGTFKTLFGKKKIAEDPESELYSPETNANPNFLTDPKQIEALLLSIEQASPLCTIIFEDMDEQFSSSILDVQMENKQLVLDELLPKEGNALLLQKNKLKLSCIHNGIRIAFMLNGIEPGSSRGIAYYKMPIPSRVYYPQRRASPRILITTLDIQFSGVSSRTQITVGGTIYDLSRGGIGINVGNNIARLQRGDLIRNCRMSLQNEALSFDISVRFVKTSRTRSRQTLIGAYFENLNPKERNKLESFVASLEREEIRNRRE